MEPYLPGDTASCFCFLVFSSGLDFVQVHEVTVPNRPYEVTIRAVEDLFRHVLQDFTQNLPPEENAGLFIIKYNEQRTASVNTFCTLSKDEAWLHAEEHSALPNRCTEQVRELLLRCRGHARRYAA